MSAQTPAPPVTRRHAAVAAALSGATLVVLGYASGWGLVVSSTAAAVPVVTPPAPITTTPQPITNTVVLPPQVIAVPAPAVVPQDSPTYPMPTPSATPTPTPASTPTPTPTPSTGCTGLLGGLTGDLPLLGGVGALLDSTLDSTLSALPVLGPLVSPAACASPGSGATGTPPNLLGARR